MIQYHEIELLIESCPSKQLQFIKTGFKHYYMYDARIPKAPAWWLLNAVFQANTHGLLIVFINFP